jgi:hypothetical protein
MNGAPGLVLFADFFRTPPVTGNIPGRFVEPTHRFAMNGEPRFRDRAPRLFGGFRSRYGLTGFEVGGGDLEAVEEQAGAAEVDLVGGNAEEDFAQAALDVVAVGGRGHVEGVAPGLAVVRVFDRLSGFVVVVAEGLAAQGGAAALDSVAEDVAAAFAVVSGAGHWCPTLPTGFGAKYG